jgi:hypothetical protein
MIEYRPATGSCARCHGALDTASLERDGVWYCCPDCAEGHPEAARQAAVPERRLFGVPRRFFRKRRPKELRSRAR